MALKPYYANRLLVVGPSSELKRFERTNWDQQIAARHLDVLESSTTRFAVQFETDEPPLDWLRKVSRRRPSLVFLLDYEDEDRRIKGLATAYRNRLDVFTAHY